MRWTLNVHEIFVKTFFGESLSVSEATTNATTKAYDFMRMWHEKGFHWENNGGPVVYFHTITSSTQEITELP